MRGPCGCRRAATGSRSPLGYQSPDSPPLEPAKVWTVGGSWATFGGPSRRASSSTATQVPSPRDLAQRPVRRARLQRPGRARQPRRHAAARQSERQPGPLADELLRHARLRLLRLRLELRDHRLVHGVRVLAPMPKRAHVTVATAPRPCSRRTGRSRCRTRTPATPRPTHQRAVPRRTPHTRTLELAVVDAEGRKNKELLTGTVTCGAPAS